MSTGFSRSVREAIIDRDEGLCRRCGAAGEELHHRRGRGAGGTSKKSANGPANGVLLCRGCHEWAERNRTAAYETGWAVRRSDARADCEVPMLRLDGTEVWLDNQCRVVLQPQLV